MYTLMLLCL